MVIFNSVKGLQYPKIRTKEEKEDKKKMYPLKNKSN